MSLLPILILSALAGGAPDDAEPWRAHPHAGELVAPQRLRSAGEGAYFALVRRTARFDGERALRPYVFRVEGGRVHDLWRGTALAWPLVGARVVEVNGRERVCALHRGDSFLHPNPATPLRRTATYSWSGFGFVRAGDPEAEEECARRWHVARAP